MVGQKSPHIASRAETKRPPLSVFLSATVIIFFMSLSAADSIGFVPDYIDGNYPDPSSGAIALAALPQLGVGSGSGQNPTSPVASQVEPVHITISSVGIDLPVQNPATTDVDTLDNLLKYGPAHLSTSAGLGTPGTAIIFAHSSHLPQVMIHNPMYQAFNQVPNVQAGDIIDVQGSDGKDYLYSAVSVVKADTNDGTTINIAPSAGTRLVLVTCDTLTGKSARFILTANYVGVDQ